MSTAKAPAAPSDRICEKTSEIRNTPLNYLKEKIVFQKPVLNKTTYKCKVDVKVC